MKNKCFEDYLYDQHSKQYRGLDDDMADDWGEWVSELDSDQLIKFADAWMKEEMATMNTKKEHNEIKGGGK